MFLEIAVVILFSALIILVFLLFRQKQQKETKTKEAQLTTSESNLQDQQITSLASQLTNSHQEIQKLKELILTTFTDHKAS
jgi:Tfp pilus assembly protein PilN